MTTVRAAVYRGAKAQRKNARGDRRTARAARLEKAGKTKRAAVQRKKAAKSYASARKAGDKYQSKQRVYSGGKTPSIGARPTKPRRPVPGGPGRKPPARPTRPGARPTRPTRGGGRCGTGSRKPGCSYPAKGRGKGSPMKKRGIRKASRRVSAYR